jgi:nucleoside-diphosphate-sugar epimerase
LEEIRSSIKKVLIFNSSTYCVGHGGPLTKELIRKRFEEKPNRLHGISAAAEEQVFNNRNSMQNE